MLKITLCGSARFEKEFKEWNAKLTLAGYVVYSLATYPSDHGENKNWYTTDQKAMLDIMHLAKIDNSDAIAVLDVKDYIGESTRREVLYACYNQKAVYYLSNGGLNLLLKERV